MFRVPQFEDENRPFKKVKLFAHVSEYSPVLDMIARFEHEAPEIELKASRWLNYSELLDPAPFSPTDTLRRSRWSDMAFVMADSDSISKIVAGNASSPVHALIRSWDVSKPILLLPEMSIDEWRNPMTKRHLMKIRSKMPWITVLEPMLWDLPVGIDTFTTWRDVSWDWVGEDILFDRILQTAQSCLENTNRSTHPLGQSFGKLPSSNSDMRTTLPPEILTMIFEYIGDF